MSEDTANSESGTEQWVYVDLYCGDERVERLAFSEGDDFQAEVHCDEWRIEVVGFQSGEIRSGRDGV